MNRLLTIACVAMLLCVPTGAKAEWSEATSRHFLVYSEGRPESVREFATKLERFDRAMRLRLNFEDVDRGPANRVTVYVVDNVAAVQRLGRFGSNSNIAGFYAARAGASIAVTPRQAGSGEPGDLDPATILLHEYSHHVMMENATAAYPAWYREGFAEFYSTARFEKNGSIGFGAAANHRAWELFGIDQQPLEALFDPESRKLRDENLEATIYGRGWLLTHYLYFSQARKGQLTAYLKALNSGTSSLEAARAAFGDLRVLERELNVYVRQKRIPYVELNGQVLAIDPVTVRPLRPGEAAIMELRMRSRLGVTKEEAGRVARDMRKAAAPYPTDSAVQAALAEAEFDAGDLDASDAAADRAIAADPKSVNAYLYKARVRMARAKASGAKDAVTWKEIRRFILLANRSDPNDPGPLMLFYRSFADQGVAPTANAVVGLVQAFALAPQDVGLRMSVAHQYLVDGKADEARDTLAPIAFDPHGGEVAKNVRLILAKLTEGGTKAALAAWHEADRETEKTKT